ncbi:MAG TPA: hypothetical protein VK506_14050 [Conexibacter sp.]|nr:hypothetical protein [Conexibacter sp.]
MAIDLQRIAASAVDSYLRQSPPKRDEQPAGEHRHRLGGARALAVGVVLGAGARVAYGRLRKLDLARVAGAVERRLAS